MKYFSTIWNVVDVMIFVISVTYFSIRLILPYREILPLSTTNVDTMAYNPNCLKCHQYP